MKARIKKGALVGQDMSFYTWGDDDTVFDVQDFDGQRKKLTAEGHGYTCMRKGCHDCYGNGPIFVNDKYLIEVEDNKIEFQKQTKPFMDDPPSPLGKPLLTNVYLYNTGFAGNWSAWPDMIKFVFYHDESIESQQVYNMDRVERYELWDQNGDYSDPDKQDEVKIIASIVDRDTACREIAEEIISGRFDSENITDRYYDNELLDIRLKQFEESKL